MDDRYLKQSRPGSRRYRKRVLAVRAMAGETAWLEGNPYWRDGRVVWELDRGTVVPNRHLIALAQRRLKQIAGYPRASRQALGDTAAWLARRFERLTVAKRLSVIQEPDLEALCSPQSLQQSAEPTLHHLASLLVAEAYCLNPLPESPSSALLSCGTHAVRPLLSLSSDPEELPIARALAALRLGALRKAGKWDTANPVFPDRCQMLSYDWGTHHGLSEDPPLLVALLETGSAELAERYQALCAFAAAYLPDSTSLRTLLWRGVAATTMIELCSACAEIAPLADHIGNYRAALPPYKHIPSRAEAASNLRNERAQTISTLVALVHRYANESADPTVVNYALVLASDIIYLRPQYHTALGDATVAALTAGLNLPLELRGSYLRLLHEERDLIWDGLDQVEDLHLSARLARVQSQDLDRIGQALQNARDPDLVRRAFKLDAVYLLAFQRFKDLDIFRFVLSLVDDFSSTNHAWGIANALARISFATAKEARQSLVSLTNAILQSPLMSRGALLESFLEALPSRAAEAHNKARQWARYIPSMTPFLDGDHAMPYELVQIVAALDKSLGDTGLRWFGDLITALVREIPPGADLTRTAFDLRLIVPLGVVLAGDDYPSFERIALTALSHQFDRNTAQVSNAATVLRNFPILGRALARIFPLQPHRCLDLAVKIGFASKLGPEFTAPLNYLEGNSLEGISLPVEWQAVIDAAPSVDEVARSYLLAQRTREASEAVPPGVRKALEQPQKIAGELAYIEHKLEADRARSDLSSRAASLRSRLANDSKLMSEVRVEIEERLGQVEAEAHIAAAEKKILECYSIRLQGLAGPLPPDLLITDDLVNATLLLGDVDSNRKLLTRLLRAYLRGDRRWHEHHPANVRYLSKLAGTGVDTQLWLSANPRKYACRGVAGGKVRLLLERDPLGVLQMGNYFDTCLSFEQFNSFSTVANACELNKRVVYAYDGVDRVIGRKLIGINREGKLIGFYTYSTLGEDDGKELRAIFRRYCADFAVRCGLEMADDGTIPRLFAQAWYDDGSVPWSEAEDEHSPQDRSKSHSGELEEPELASNVSAVP